MTEYSIRVQDAIRDTYLRKNYGMSLFDYNNILDLQGRKCYLCQRSVNQFPKSLNVDHNHKTGLVRGLLCTNCNYLVGIIEKRGASTVENFIRNLASGYLNRDALKMIRDEE